jgi:hypothetical protein
MEKIMNKRKQILIDKKFQLKTAFTIIGVVTILTVLIIVAISLTAAYNNDRIHKIIRSEDKIFQALTVITSKNIKEQPVLDSTKQMSRDHINNFELSDRIVDNNRILMIALIVFVVVQGIILYFMMLYKTHRISGPIYVMSMYMKQMIEGKYPVPRSLRKNDEFMEFYELFKQLIATLKDREKGK